MLRSSAYLAADLVAMVAMFVASTLIDHPSVPRLVAYGLLWPLYWFFQGAVATGVWVIAHECGELLHHAVSAVFVHTVESPCLCLSLTEANIIDAAGHQAFSKWQAVNDGVGLVLHSCLLVPYYSW